MLPVRHRGDVVGVGVAVVANRHLGGDLRAVLQLDLLFHPRCHVLIHCIDLLSIFLTHYSLVTAKYYTSISHPYGVRQHRRGGAHAGDEDLSPLDHDSTSQWPPLEDPTWRSFPDLTSALRCHSTPLTDNFTAIDNSWAAAEGLAVK